MSDPIFQWNYSFFRNFSFEKFFYLINKFIRVYKNYECLFSHKSFENVLLWVTGDPIFTTCFCCFPLFFLFFFHKPSPVTENEAPSNNLSKTTECIDLEKTINEASTKNQKDHQTKTLEEIHWTRSKYIYSWF